MDSVYHGRPPTRRRVLADASNRANESHSIPRGEDKYGSEFTQGASSKPLPHNESLVANGTLSVRHEQQVSTAGHLSASPAHDARPSNSKRDSQISTTSTNASNTNRRRKTHIGPWQLGKTIGRGGCSRVRLVRHSRTGQFGAAKIISKATAEKVRALSLANLCQSAQHDPTLFPDGKVIPFGLEREICIMKLLDHPNIVRLYDIWENHNELYLIMEFIEGGELFNYIHETGGLREIHTIHIFRQIIAALLYCHRINIHHRDLKPENILLDRETMTVKLVDFGMAALQPTGKKLTTPCGSPHYAAPEVIKTMAYDGAKADVWSCGVILYVLLTGTPPFNYSGEDRHLKNLFQDIATAKYVMPDNISREAQDLIRRILVADPKRRIGLDEIWNHPFMGKHHEELEFVGDTTRQDHWTGPLPAIDDWTPLERHAIDRELLRYLRTLWHSEKEEVIVHRLLCPEPNQEKYFYAALRKYHTDQLENYQPSAHHVVAHSNSDHHHNKPHSPQQQDLENLPTAKTLRSKSGFSILNDEHLYSRQSLYEAPVSEGSYDPFRSSRQPVVPEPSAILQNVTVHRGLSQGSRRLRPAVVMTPRTGSSLRIQALRNSKRSPAVSRVSSNRSTPSYRTASVNRRSMSRSSLGSSRWQPSPAVVRPGGLGRRGVSFSHLRERRPSGATMSTMDTDAVAYVDYASSYGARSSFDSHDYSQRSSTVRQSPAYIPKSRVGVPREAARLQVRKLESPTKYIQGEARKVSLELGKVMQEAFFDRSSVGSSIHTTMTGKDVYQELSQCDTPPTSISNRASGGSTRATPDKMMLAQRPLPPIPVETPNTFVQRKLAETRAEIAQRLGEDGQSIEQVNAVLEHLDLLIIPGLPTKRVVSAPAKSPEHPSPLHVIPEEGRSEAGDGFEYSAPYYRAFTDPIRPQGRRSVTEQPTIRHVIESPAYVAPLNIRKRASGSLKSKSPNDTPAAPWSDSTANTTVRPYQDVQNDLYAARKKEIAVPADKPELVIKKKKSLWFRRNTEEKDEEQEKQEQPIQAQKQQSTGTKIPEAWQDLDDRIKKEPPQPKTMYNVNVTSQESRPSTGSEFPMRIDSPAAAKSDGVQQRRGFFGLFGKKTKDEKNKKPVELSVNTSTSSIITNSEISPEYSNGNSSDGATRNGPADVQLNWLSRFLHIKPASRTLCFQIGRGKVRQDLVRLLRDWQRFGVRDVEFDRETNVISASIDKNNHLKSKPVSFIIELFVVLHHDRRAKLCLARFTQSRGAASSFRKFVDIVEDVCRARGMLVEDIAKRDAMLETIA